MSHLAILITLSLLLLPTSQAKVTDGKNRKMLLVEVPLSLADLEVKAQNLHGKKTNPVKSELAQLKKMEDEKQWAACTRSAKKQFTTQKTIRQWILLTWLHCARRGDEDQKNQKASEAPLAELEKNRDLLAAGPARAALIQEMTKSRLQLAEGYDRSESKNSLPAIGNLDLLLSYGEKVDKEARARAFYYLSEIAQFEHFLRGEQLFLEESLNEKESGEAREKLNSVLTALGEKATEPVEKNIELAIPENEKKSEDRLEQSLKLNDYMTYVEDGVAYLNRFPNGRKAKGVQEKILEIYAQVGEHIGSPGDADPQKYIELRERTISFMEKIEPSRALEWAKLSHRHGDYFGSFRLAEKSLPALLHSTSSAQVLWLLGRSGQFLGQYDKAQKYFEQYLELNSGGEETAEVLFRLALVRLRQHQYSSAVAALEKLLVAKGGDHFELNARYWLVRALEQQNNIRSQTEAAQLVAKFPFSYYGLRLRAESQKGNLLWSDELKKSPDISGSLVLSPAEKQTFLKIQLLAENEWYFAAQKEIQEFPTPRNPEIKVLLAKKWLGAKAYPMVARLINDAGDGDSRFRTLNLMAMGFPEEYPEIIKSEAEKNKLDPILIRSLIRQESSFGPQAVSSSNALGLMQLIPPTAQEVAKELKLGKIDIPEDVFDPITNIAMGSHYLAKMIHRFAGSVPLALAAYNAGPQRLKGFIDSRAEVTAMIGKLTSVPFDEIWIDELPWSETSFYVKAILRNSLIYKTFEQGQIIVPTVIWADLVQSPGASGHL